MNRKALLHASVFTPTRHGWGLPTLWEGPPGIGKTTEVEELGETTGLRVVTLIGSICEPTDFKGFPICDGDVTRYSALSWAVELAEEGGGIVLLDEFNHAPPSVQSAMLRMVLDKVVGDFELPGGVRFIASQNSVSDTSGAWELSPPMANRFGHLPWNAPTVDDWSDWLLGTHVKTKGTLKTAEIEAQVMRSWPEAFARAKGIVAGFLAARPDLLMKMPVTGHKNRDKAWPSPRSWESATRCIASAEVHGLDEVTADAFLTAHVGAGPAMELVAWRKNADLPNPVDVLDGRVVFQHRPARLDRTSAVLTACAAVLQTDKNRNRVSTRSDVLWDLLGTVSSTAADLIVRPAQVLINMGQLASPTARKTLSSMQAVVAAARMN